MTKVISFINQKGGVGKTTSAVNIAAALALDGFKTLLIDLDQQGNATQGLGINNPEYTIAGSLSGSEAVMTYPVKENLDIIPCDVNFSGIEQTLDAPAYKEVIKKIGKINLLKELVNSIEGYDIIIMDCPPALGFVTVSALISSEYVFIPLIAQLYSISGVKEVLKTFEHIKEKYNPSLNLAGLFFTLYDMRTILAKDLSDNVKDLAKGNLLETKIRKSVVLEESPSLGVDIFEYKPDSNAAQDYRNLSDEIKSIVFPDKFSKPDLNKPIGGAADVLQMFEAYLEEGGDNE